MDNTELQSAKDYYHALKGPSRKYAVEMPFVIANYIELLEKALGIETSEE